MKKAFCVIVILAIGWFLFPDEFRAVGVYLKEVATLIILGK